MDALDLSRLVNEHFDLLDQKQMIDRKLHANQTKAAELLARLGHFDLLTVNWTRARQTLPRKT